jgi:rhamnosyltransferase
MTGIKAGWKLVEAVDILILANDSCYGPFYDIQDLFSRLKKANSSFIGLTDSTVISHHIQSYFTAYRKELIGHPLFKAFWSNIRVYGQKIDIIRSNEIEWCDQLRAIGVEPMALYTSQPHENMCHTSWRELLIDCKFPFVKVELLRDNPTRQNIMHWQQTLAALDPVCTNHVISHLGYLQENGLLNSNALMREEGVDTEDDKTLMRETGVRDDVSAR